MGDNRAPVDHDRIRREQKAKQRANARKGKQRRNEGEGLGFVQLSPQEEARLAATFRRKRDEEKREEESRRYVLAQITKVLTHTEDLRVLRVCLDPKLASFEQAPAVEHGRFQSVNVGSGLYRKLFFEVRDLEDIYFMLQSRARDNLMIMRRRVPLSLSGRITF
jgi:hypothetical protein